MNITLDQIAAIVKGQLVNGSDGVAMGASIDSRTIKAGDLFFALPGERVDGHDYVEQAFKAGAAAAVVARNVDGGPLIIVKDVQEALQQLAAHHRASFDIPLIAVTGSVGKTTTKDLLAACLEGTYHTLKTSGNYNNELGLPLTLLQLTDQHQACVAELGMSEPGEIDLLARISAPTAAIIVNAEAVHLESMGTIENIARAKCEVLPHTRDFAVINGDSFELEKACRTDLPIYWFGTGVKCMWRVVRASYREPGTDITLAIADKEFSVYVPLPAMHLTYNVCAAVGTAMQLGISPEEIKKRLQAFSSSARRMQIKPGLKGITIIDDCYNANPQSMAGAVRVLKTIAGQRRTIAVLGDMYELGDYEQEGHRWVGKTAAETGVDILVAIGEKAVNIIEGVGLSMGSSRAKHFIQTDKALEYLMDIIEPDDVVLVKASRGMKLEKIVDTLTSQEDLT